jgi:hypothetical protein
MIDGEDADVIFLKKYIKLAVITLFMLLIITTLIPTKETTYTMLAAYGVEGIAKSNTVHRLAPKSIALLEQYMDEQLTKSDAK